MAFVFEVLHMEQMLLTMEHMARERAGKAASLNQVFWGSKIDNIVVKRHLWSEAEGIIASDFLENQFDMERALWLGSSGDI